jgi:hypothetical protein
VIDLEPNLTLKPETAFFIALTARTFDAKTAPSDPDEGSNPTDDKAVDVLEFQPDDPTEEQLRGLLAELNEDERLDLIALIWIGRGDFGLEQWAEAREAARMISPEHLPTYVLEMPLVSDYLQEALSQLDLSVGDYLDGALERSEFSGQA